MVISAMVRPASAGARQSALTPHFTPTRQSAAQVQALDPAFAKAAIICCEGRLRASLIFTPLNWAWSASKLINLLRGPALGSLAPVWAQGSLAEAVGETK